MWLTLGYCGVPGPIRSFNFSFSVSFSRIDNLDSNFYVYGCWTLYPRLLRIMYKHLGEQWTFLKSYMVTIQQTMYNVGYIFLTVYMGWYTRLELIWPRGVSRGAICADSLGTPSYDINSFYDKVLYVTVKCTNGAGLTSTASIDGGRRLESPPKSDHVSLSVLTSSLTLYPTRGIYHGDPTRLKFRWKDFNLYQNISIYSVCRQINVVNAVHISI